MQTCRSNISGLVGLARRARLANRPSLVGVAFLAGTALVASVLLSPSNAEAHFRLLYPPQWIAESDAFGDPQKAAPCGVDPKVNYTPTNEVTAFSPGQTIQLHFVETVPHDGWYRISISYAGRKDLTDPTYQTYASGPMTGYSEDASIEQKPYAPPVVADGVFIHKMADTQVPKDYTYDLTLPTQPCAKCTLQIEQIMLNHPVNQTDGPFTYHHCADIAIVEGGDGGTVKEVDGGSVALPPGQNDGGGSGGGTTSGAGAGSSSGALSSGGADEGGSDAGPGSASGGNSGNASGGGSSGCDASGSALRQTGAAAGLGLLVGALAAGFRRRRRAPISSASRIP